MFKTIQPIRHTLHAIAVSFVLFGMSTVAPHALAQDGHDHATVDPTDRLTVVRDAETGLLRAPTAEERSAMHEKAARRRDGRIPAPRMQQKWHHSGAIGTRVTDELMSTSVAVRKPDGGVAQQCFDSREEADAAIKGAGTGISIATKAAATQATE